MINLHIIPIVLCGLLLGGIIIHSSLSLDLSSIVPCYDDRGNIIKELELT